MSEPLTFDIRIWLTEGQYAGLLRLAHADDRPLSAYVRRLIQRDLDENLVPVLGLSQERGGSGGGRHE
jgi:hypothetical protein